MGEIPAWATILLGLVETSVLLTGLVAAVVLLHKDNGPRSNCSCQGPEMGRDG